MSYADGERGKPYVAPTVGRDTVIELIDAARMVQARRGKWPFVTIVIGRERTVVYVGSLN